MDFKKALLRFKPGASVRTHLFLAGLIWSTVGLFLLTNGIIFILQGNIIWLTAAGLALGTVKTFYVLDRVARKNIMRIKEFGEKVCLGSVYSWKTWLLVAAMISLGRFLRTTVLPAEIVGLLYTAVGWALTLASRLMWREWYRNP